MARTTVANAIGPPQSQFFKDVIKITGDGYNYKRKLKQQYIKKVHKCWIWNNFPRFLLEYTINHYKSRQLNERYMCYTNGFDFVRLIYNEILKAEYAFDKSTWISLVV